MKNLFAFTFIGVLLSFSSSLSFAQDSTSIKIILPQTEEWKIDEVTMTYYPPVLVERYVDFNFSKIDSATNTWLTKIPKDISGDCFFAIGEKIGFGFLVLPNDEIEISFDEEEKPIFLKGKIAKENQITYEWADSYYYSFTSWANEDSTTYIAKVDSMTRKVLFDYESATKDFTPNPIFDTFFRNQLVIEQLRALGHYPSNRNKYLQKENIYEKMPLEYYEAEPKLKMIAEENQIYSTEYISNLYHQLINENCRKNEYEQINNATIFCTYQYIKTMKESKLKKLLIITVLDELIQSWSQDENKLDIVYEEFKRSYPNDEYTKFLEEKITLEKRFAKGQDAPTFSLKNKEGKEVSLSDLKGKYVFIDFWATWCGPCMSEVPYSKKLEEEFKNKEIEFVYICIDDSEENWEKHISKEESIGIQLFADKEKSKELRDNYNINGIPSYMLVDKEGKIVTQKIRPSKNGKEILEQIFQEEK